MRQFPTRRRSFSWPLRNLISPVKGSPSISSIAARIRTRSGGGIRLRDFCAGPARTTRHFFFSAEFIEGDIVPALERSLASADSTQLGARRILFSNIEGRKIPLNRFHCEVGWFPPLLPRRSVNTPAHCGWKFDCVLSFTHFKKDQRLTKECQSGPSPDDPPPSIIIVVDFVTAKASSFGGWRSL